jgi:signal transduction histidine kinase
MEAVAEEARLIAEKAQATDRFKNRFLANMSHEIRTPLNHIIGLTEFVLENDLDEDSRESMETVVQSARSLLEMVNNLIEFSRLDSYEKNQDLRRTSVQSMINDVLVSENRQVTEHHVEIKTRVSGKIPEIIAVDTQKLKMILSCLIDNAIKFSDDGTVEIETEVERENEDHLMLLFKVSDTGIGIAKENQEKIFESFFQVDSSSTRKHGGTGVGLALAQGLVSFLGGRIWVESELGSGSTFYFTAKVYPSTLEEEDE